MNRRAFLKKTALASAAAFMAGCTKDGLTIGAMDNSKTRPNIVLILCDDLGYGELGCYGQKHIKTPNVDALAAKGMKFTDFYSSTAVCAPARCMLMTGKHSGHAYIRDNHEIGKWESFDGQLPLPTGTKTIATMLKDQGYATGAFGKWGLGAPDSTGDPLKMGFDRFYGYNCQRHAHNLYPKYLVSDHEHHVLEGNTRGLTGKHYAPQMIADEMLKFVRENHEKPFFVYYPTVIPHLPLQVPDEFLNMYKGKWDEKPYDGRGGYLPHPNPKSAYAGMITFMDHQVGRLVSLLKELKVDDNTIIMFTSDNGATHCPQVDYTFFNSAAGFKGLKGSLHEGGIREPFIVRWPGKVKPASVSDLPAVHYDLMATIADMANLPAPTDTDGVSLVPTMTGNDSKQKIHDYLYWEFPGYGGQFCIRMGKWKAVRTNVKKNPNSPWELYDLSKDPAEKNNLAAKHPEIVKKAQDIVLKTRTRTGNKRFDFGPYAG